MTAHFAVSDEIKIIKGQIDPKTTGIYCDMDQVLVNFLGGARRALGKEFNDAELGTNEHKWLFLATVQEFWFHLEWMPGAQMLWNVIRGYNTHILSACPDGMLMPLCPDEKKRWCVQHLGISSDRVQTVMREDKHKFAMLDGRPQLLIDDHPRNVAEWIAAGGVAIHHFTVPETIARLRFLGFVQT